MDLSERKKKILSAIVDSYIATAEPVGSKAIAETSRLGLSSATIRNEMAELTALGLLEQPHTSAGRIPSALGYRIYVNELMRQHKLSLEETDAINHSLNARIKQLDQLILNAGRAVSNIINYPAYALAAAPSSVTVRRFDFIFVDANTFILVLTLSNNSTQSKLINLPFRISESKLKKFSTLFNLNFTSLTEDEITRDLISTVERAAGDSLGIVAAIAGFVISSLSGLKSKHAYFAGASRILELPEYRDVDKAQRLMSYLSDSSELLKLPVPDEENPIKIMIGPENIAEELHDSSVIVASYTVDEDVQGLIGVVGPTRMDYSKVAARLSYIANSLGLLFTSEDLPSPADPNNCNE